MRSGGELARRGLLLALTALLAGGFGTIYEAWVIDTTSLAVYYLYGTAFQAVWSTALAWPHRSTLPEVLRSPHRTHIAGYNVTRGLRGFTFLAALAVSGNAALVSSFISFLPVLVVVTAYFTMGETDNLKTKAVSVALGTAGLFLVAS